MHANADTLADVRAAVKRLAAKHPVHATLTIEQSVQASGRFANRNAVRAASAEVAHDGEGVSVKVPQTLIDKAVRDVDARDAIGSIRMLALTEALNFREAMLVMLEGASVVEEKASTYRGQPARLLSLELAPRKQRSNNSIEIGSTKSDDRLTLWIGADGVPLAGERVENTNAGFLFIRANYSARTSYTFARIEDRLVLVRMETKEGGSGMGQNVGKTSVQTLALRQASG